MEMGSGMIRYTLEKEHSERCTGAKSVTVYTDTTFPPSSEGDEFSLSGSVFELPFVVQNPSNELS